MSRPAKRGRRPTRKSTRKSAGKSARRLTPRPARQSPRAAPEAFYELRLYIAGQTSRSIAALANLKEICEEHLHGRYHIEVIDLLERPQLAKGDQILALPTLVRRLPEPIRKLVGDLSDTERALVGLDLRPARPRRA